MRIKKVYGASKTLTCPFCERTATQKNDQGLEVCHLHIKTNLEEFKCLCGSWLELKVGKFGPYFNCIKCGNMNYKKAMEIKKATETKEKSNSPQLKIPERKKELTERIITSNDVEYFD